MSAEIMKEIIPAGTGVGAVHLAVTDRDRSLRFWRDVLGLSLLSEEDDLIRLGAGERELVVLHPGATRPVVRGATGLYHLAILLPNRRELARVLARLLSLRYPNAPTDHVMTKTTYLDDLDGNGIELYADTPEDGEWTFADGSFIARTADGQLRSGRDPLDVAALLEELSPEDSIEDPMPSGTKMGHVHLHVANLEEAVHFYGNVLGFELQGIAPEIGMAFLSAGGYHHHIGLNTWAGEGAPPAPAGVAGLKHFTIEVPSEQELAHVVTRVARNGFRTIEDPIGALVDDPSGNRVHLVNGSR
jgi:catechol 2,3-dioxygenase